MNKVLLIISLVFIAYGIVMFAIDFLPVDLFNDNKNDSYVYMKMVETDSFPWSKYRLHSLITGFVFFIIYKLV